MAKFSVEQVVLCEVRVWYQLEANSDTHALKIVSEDECPTSNDTGKPFRDYEIISDGKMSYTKIERIKDEG
jgi:hypothetical protein